MNRVGVAALAVLGSVLLAVSPAAAADRPTGRAEEVRLVAVGDTTLGYGGHRYAGPIEIRFVAGRLAVVEETDLDAYLLGIREVPFSWEEEALAAQAVAARTYLAWTLERGRTPAGSTFGFDICASTACQVYSGADWAQAPDGDRWAAAVAATAGEILVYSGSPAQTLYSSSSGGRTRANQDIWGGGAVPYLQPVDSPEEGVSPFWDWEIAVPLDVFTQILRFAGNRVAGIAAMRVERPPEGEGPAVVAITHEAGVLELDPTEVRWTMDRWGPLLFPGLLPAARPDGRRWPQALLSYTFDVTIELPEAPDFPPGLLALLPPEDRPAPGTVRFRGTGWGHGIGMSQWGAEAMARTGADHHAILAHYYGGLEPVAGGGLLPDAVEVGLAWEVGEVSVDADGAFALLADGIPVDILPPGEWTLRAAPDGIAVVPPEGYPVDLRTAVFGRQWAR